MYTPKQWPLQDQLINAWYAQYHLFTQPHSCLVNAESPTIKIILKDRGSMSNCQLKAGIYLAVVRMLFWPVRQFTPFYIQASSLGGNNKTKKAIRSHKYFFFSSPMYGTIHHNSKLWYWVIYKLSMPSCCKKMEMDLEEMSNFLMEELKIQEAISSWPVINHC